MKTRHQIYYEANKDKEKAKVKRWTEANQEHVKEHRKAYRAGRKAEDREYNKKWRQENLEYAKNRDKEYRLKNPDKGAKRQATYRAKHRERLRLESKENYLKRKPYFKSWQEKNKVKESKRLRESHLKRKYDLTLEQYNSMKAKQKDCCAICYTHISKLNPKFGLVVDHDHETGMVRGLLCHTCNIGLARFDDDMDILQNAIDYLNRQGGP